MPTSCDGTVSTRSATAWERTVVTSTDAPRRGFWYQVGRPFRALGRGVARVIELLDLVSLIGNVVRGVVWLFRLVGRVLFDG